MELLINPQSSSILFHALPQELRDQIYADYFDATLLIWGRTNADGRLFKHPEHALALLRTCQRAREEIGRCWIGQVVFNFEHPEEMLNTLAALPKDSISRIRHLRLFGDHILLCTHDFEKNQPVEYILNSALKRTFSGLRPDLALTVLGTLQELPCSNFSHMVLSTYVKDVSDGTFDLPRTCYSLSANLIMEHIQGAAKNLTYCGERFPILFGLHEHDPRQPERALLAWRARKEGPFSSNSSARAPHLMHAVRSRSSRPDYSEEEGSVENRPRTSTNASD